MGVYSEPPREIYEARLNSIMLSSRARGMMRSVICAADSLRNASILRSVRGIFACVILKILVLRIVQRAQILHIQYTSLINYKIQNELKFLYTIFELQHNDGQHSGSVSEHSEGSRRVGK